MTESTDKSPPAKAAAPRGGRLALLLAVIALAASGAQWLGLAGNKEFQRVRSEDLARTQRRLNNLEDRIQRERDDLNRLAEKVGVESTTEDSLAGRITRLEDTLARLPGGKDVRFLWLIEQAEYFMRIANAQENLAGNSTGALTALAIADEYLRDTTDPRISAARKLLAGEMAALRAVPRVDTEGAILKLGSLGESLPQLPRRQTAPAQFAPEPAAPPPTASGLERAADALRNAFFSIVSVRRTDVPTATLLTDEAATLLTRSLELELQMARLAMLRADTAAFRTSMAALRRDLDKYFDTATPAGAAALATLDELAGMKMPESLPDISGSLAELLRVKERETAS